MRRTSDEEKKLTNTYRADRAVPAAPVSDPLVPPPYLNELQQEQFTVLAKRLAAERRASSSQTELVAMAAIHLSAIIDCQKDIDTHGRLQAGQSFRRANPAVAMQVKSLTALRSILADLGLSMTAARAPEGEEEEDSENPFDEFA